MNKVKYSEYSHHSLPYLTNGKIYDVLGYSNDDKLVIMDDIGYVKDYFSDYENYRIKFEDATTEYRNEIIEEILL